MGRPKDKGPKGTCGMPRALNKANRTKARKAPRAMISPWAKLAKFKIPYVKERPIAPRVIMLPEMTP